MRARLLALCATLPVAVTGAAAAVTAADSFTLQATQQDLGNYYPTYLANGYWSVASSPLGVAPTSSQMVGLMDRTPGDVSRPAAVPEWNEIDYFDGAHWLSGGNVTTPAFSHYRQSLDMHGAVLRTCYRWRAGAHTSDLSTTTFVSQSDAHLAAVTLELTPRFSGRIRLRFTLRGLPPPVRLPLARLSAEQFAAAADAASQPDLAAGGNRSAIWYPGQVNIVTSGGDAAARMLWMDAGAVGDRRLGLAVAVALPATLRQVRTRFTSEEGVLGLEVDAQVQRNRRYRVTKYVAASAEGWGGDAAADRILAGRFRSTGLRALQAAHSRAWEKLWRSDIEVGGDSTLQRTIHSDLFYLLENTTAGTTWPVAACGFSSHYFGHVFWDNDLWVFPALLLLHPERARPLIEFRVRTLPQALARAAAHGFPGAMYPWEADPGTGEDVTPAFAVENADREIHVDGAVALAQWQYYLASGDRGWLASQGYPVLSAVADFWAARVTPNATRDRFEVLDVTSPEEDYLHVDNEIYTNEVAWRSLQAAIEAAKVLGRTAHAGWLTVADRLYRPARTTGGTYQDFDPSTPHDKTTSWMATSVPMLSIPALGFDADGATLQGLLRHSVEAIGKVRDRANQMILVMLAIQATVAGNTAYFADFLGAAPSSAAPGGGAADSAASGGADPFLKPPFNVRSETPQNDSIYLLATSGGYLQAFLFGLSGLRLDTHGLAEKFPPALPPSLSFLKLKNLNVRGRSMDVMISRKSGRVQRTVTPHLP